MAPSAVEVGPVHEFIRHATGVSHGCTASQQHKQAVGKHGNCKRQKCALWNGSRRVLKKSFFFSLKKNHLARTFKSPEMFAPAWMPVTDGKKIAKTEKKFWSTPSLKR
jgi:hypothetical protein